MAWTINYSEAGFKSLQKLDKPIARRIKSFLDNWVALLENPRNIGQALKGSRLGEFWKYRVGEYRIIARIEDETINVLVLKVGHRRDVYQD